jgi:hypothetical protein
VPDFSTLSRRHKTLAVNIPHRSALESLHLLIDSIGIKVASTALTAEPCDSRSARVPTDRLKTEPDTAAHRKKTMNTTKTGP